MSSRPVVRIFAVAATVVAVFVFSFAAARLTGSSAIAAEVTFTDLEKQSREFIAYEGAIELTPEQEAIKKKALEAIPAPCCDDNTAYTCCCPCNMALTIWGLAAVMITDHGADAATVQAKVEEWIEYINPDGFSGDECYTAKCNNSFRNSGCGGMSADRPVF